MAKIRKNQIWKDNKAQGTRFVCVLDTPVDGRVPIATFYRGEDGELPTEIKGAPRITAHERRFNNKYDGYTLVANSKKEFLDQKLHLAAFVNSPETLVDQDVVESVVSPYVPTMARGEIWREIEPRYIRFVEIEGCDVSGEKNRIITRFFTEENGTSVQPMPLARASYAKRERFNGKRKGYEFVAENLQALMERSDLLQEIFLGEDQPAKAQIQAKVYESAVSLKQLWRDRRGSLLRFVEVVAINGDTVEVASRYVQEKQEEQPRRVSMNVTEEVSRQSFEPQGGFEFVAAL